MDRHRRVRTLRSILRGIVQVTLLGGGVGIVSTLAATAFVAAVIASERHLLVPLGFEGGAREWLFLAALLVCGGLVVGALRWWNRPAAMQGPANAIAAAHGLERMMPVVPGLRTVAASVVSIVSGASVGQYGPLAHMGSLLGFMTARLAGGDAARRSIGIACGAAAAISTAFNAPIAGIVFAHEVILRHFSLRAFAPVTVAASIGYVFTNFIQPHDPMFALVDPLTVLAPEYVYFAVIGIAGGLIAVIYMRAIFAFEHLGRVSRIPEFLRPAAAGVVVALIAWQVPEVLGVGEGSLRKALAGGFGPAELGLILAAKLAATALCLGFGFVGGVFSPSLLIGVVFGTLCGASVELLLPAEHSDLAIYAACGMVAVVSPVIGAPLTAILIIFELTRNYDVTTAAMLSAVMSNLVAYRVFGRSFFDRQLLRGGHDLSMGREKLVLSVRTVRDLVDKDAVVIDESADAGGARTALAAADRALAPVVDGGGGLVGVARLSALVDVDPTIPIAGLIERDSMALDQHTPVWRAMSLADSSTDDLFAVVDASGVVQGTVSRRDIVSAYLNVTRSVRREQNGVV